MMRVLAVSALVGAALSVVGCVSSEPRLSQQEYEREMQAIAHDMNGAAAGALAEAFASASSEQDFVELLTRMSGVVRDAADRVGDITPPEEIEEPHHELADSLDEAADVFEETIDRTEDGDFFGAMEALDDAPDDLGSNARDAIAEIRAAGYYIGDDDDWG